MTTRTKLPASCIECSTKLTRANRASSPTNTSGTSYPGADDTCATCMEYFAWENTHNDEGHDADNIDSTCWVCQKVFADEIDDEMPAVTVETGRKNMSHATCTHERNAKGRAACRASHKK
jgi:hypothetical protein